MNDHSSSSNPSLRGERPNGAQAGMYAIDPEMLEAMLVEATDNAPAVNDPSLASDDDLETDDLQAIGAAASDAPPKTQTGCPKTQTGCPKTQTGCPKTQSGCTTKTATERCQKTCGGCRG
ncbi:MULTISPECIES: hypothetical protein [Burkholderia cepacia complex]|uniref:hypothetical protein n=1 Tax=Burkholderia cepacia complex TaxID=87882 RepID=UPI00064C3D09|nr:MULTISPECIES: hypothetical protein [Burkholderia cepacia complex]